MSIENEIVKRIIFFIKFAIICVGIQIITQNNLQAKEININALEMNMDKEKNLLSADGSVVIYDLEGNKINTEKAEYNKIKEELNTDKLYREFEVDYSDFINDLDEKKFEKNEYDIKNLIKKIKIFFNKKNYFIKFDELEKLNVEQFINTICMISPFTIEEKQKLVEAIKIEKKIKILEKLINFELADNFKSRTIQ